MLSAMGIEKRQDFPKKHVHNYWKGHIHISHISAISSGWDSWGGGHLPVGQFEAGRDAFPSSIPWKWGRSQRPGKPEPVAKFLVTGRLLPLRLGRTSVDKPNNSLATERGRGMIACSHSLLSSYHMLRC